MTQKKKLLWTAYSTLHIVLYSLSQSLLESSNPTSTTTTIKLLTEARKFCKCNICNATAKVHLNCVNTMLILYNTRYLQKNLSLYIDIYRINVREKFNAWLSLSLCEHEAAYMRHTSQITISYTKALAWIK